jgi:hypothetical protein
LRLSAIQVALVAAHVDVVIDAARVVVIVLALIVVVRVAHSGGVVLVVIEDAGDNQKTGKGQNRSRAGNLSNMNRSFLRGSSTTVTIT